MESFRVLGNFEFYEVINEFPILNEILSKLHLNSNELKEGESIDHFFERKNFKADEKIFYLRKINQSIKYYLKNGEIPYSKLKENNLSQEEEE